MTANRTDRGLRGSLSPDGAACSPTEGARARIARSSMKVERRISSPTAPLRNRIRDKIDDHVCLNVPRSQSATDDSIVKLLGQHGQVENQGWRSRLQRNNGQKRFSYAETRPSTH